MKKVNKDLFKGFFSITCFSKMKLSCIVWIRVCIRNSDPDPATRRIRIQYGSGSKILEWGDKDKAWAPWGSHRCAKSNEEKRSGLRTLVHIQCGVTIKYCKSPQKISVKKIRTRCRTWMKQDSGWSASTAYWNSSSCRSWARILTATCTSSDGLSAFPKVLQDPATGRIRIRNNAFWYGSGLLCSSYL